MAGCAIGGQYKRIWPKRIPSILAMTGDLVRCTSRMIALTDPTKQELGGTEALAGLLEAASGGDEAAWRDVIGLYGRRVYALIKSRCRNESLAEELTQSVFATVATKLGQGQYTEQGKFESWLFRIAMNRVRDEARRAKHRPVPVDPATFNDRPQQLAVESQDPSKIDALRDAIKLLPDSDQEVVVLRHHGGMSFKAISELLEEPVGTLLARHHRALRKLKQILESGQSPETEQ